MDVKRMIAEARDRSPSSVCSATPTRRTVSRSSQRPRCREAVAGEGGEGSTHQGKGEGVAGSGSPPGPQAPT
jgi:hypothetical protein